MSHMDKLIPLIAALALAACTGDPARDAVTMRALEDFSEGFVAGMEASSPALECYTTAYGRTRCYR